MGVPDSSYSNLKNSSTQTLQINVCKVFPCLFPIMTEYADPAWCPFGNSSRGFFNPVRSFSYVSNAPHMPGEYSVHPATNNTARLCSRLYGNRESSNAGPAERASKNGARNMDWISQPITAGKERSCQILFPLRTFLHQIFLHCPIKDFRRFQSNQMPSSKWNWPRIRTVRRKSAFQ